jgi:hypothetical protein
LKPREEALMDKIIPWLVPAVLGGMGIGSYLFLLGREWARWRWQYEAIRRRPKER